jgi:site-specific recombinase XerD
MFNSPHYRKVQEAAERGKSFKVPTCKAHFFVRGSVSVIVFRVVVNGKRSNNKSTGIKVTASTFDPRSLTIQNDPDNSTRLRTLSNEVQRIFKNREISGHSLDPTVIRDIALGLRSQYDEQTPTVIEAMKRYLDWHEQRHINKDLKILSLKRYRSYVKTLTEFFTLRPGYGPSVRFAQLTPALEHHLITDFLKGQRKYCHEYAVKVFSYFRQFVEYAIAHEWADRNPVKHVRLRKQRREPVTLTMADVKRLQSFEFVELHANQVRDVFLFSIFTGLAYVDVAELNENHLTTIKDVPCILKSRAKSGVQSFIPLFPEARAILDKYDQHAGCRMKGVLLPVLSNQKMNNWLKIIGNTVGIKERLHTHLARKSFTMYSEELGFTLTDMAVMMGHTNTAMTESHYYQRRREPVITRFKEIFRNTGNTPDENAQQAS